MKEPIYITAFSSLSAIGSNEDEIWKSYLCDEHKISTRNYGDKPVFVAQLSPNDKEKINELRLSDNKYKNLDDSVLFAIYSSRKTIENANWNTKDNFGINIGSSRGATNLFEKYHEEFIQTGQSSTLSSPTTTLGNISSWVAHDLQSNGPEISHSITCSTALHSLLNGVAWLNSGMCDKFLIGGSEAPLTAFTIAQMQALKVYANEIDKYPCKAFDLEKTKNTMVLGEGASTVCLEKAPNQKYIAKIIGIGYATEILKHNTSVTTDADCFQKSMKMAIQDINPKDVDIIVMHAPGTKRGDSSEVNAIAKVFGDDVPFLTTNKWKLGHTFGASGLLSLEFALLMLKNQRAIEVPFAKKQPFPKKIRNILINAVGFGGNAVSVLISE